HRWTPSPHANTKSSASWPKARTTPPSPPPSSSPNARSASTSATSFSNSAYHPATTATAESSPSSPTSTTPERNKRQPFATPGSAPMPVDRVPKRARPGVDHGDAEGGLIAAGELVEADGHGQISSGWCRIRPHGGLSRSRSG